MKKSDFIRLIDANEFRELFVMHLGWNRWRVSARLVPISVDGIDYQFQTVAERSGLQVVVAEVDALPNNSLARKIDNQLRRQAQDYIAIYTLRSNPKHHLWVVPLKNVDKRDLVSLEYIDAAHADFLFSKLDDIEFSPGQATTIVDVKEAVHRAFFVNSEKITKDFYAGFKKQHSAFAKFITGIDDEIAVKDNRNKQWYASVMLNRLMFCYFIQKKGFLDGNPNYLRDKLEQCVRERGENKFFSTFYLGFLRRLFSDGLNHPKHNREFELMFGRIPYLNGGMFDKHQIERDYANIDIEDDAFKTLFEFFDRWQWHLDTRVTASGRDINPDVLGYIFEQYINDRAQMGAYYTKEDITEYIGRNTILPFLFDRVARSSKAVEAMFAPGGWVWQTLRSSGGRYLFDAVKQGWTPDWQDRIPQEIAAGLDTQAPGLLQRRARWNDRTPEPFALPTEIWRETIERLQRVDDIMAKIAAGEITSINDFITYNLDIRLFASDLIAKAESGAFVYNFYQALRSVTVLDPTCGSGAFLFAAMNILEPLYYECIMRLDEYKDNPKVKAALEEIDKKYRSNIHYFIFKSIILRNLYGVDIMVEATEIAKLRLFLKMVAVVDVDYRADNLGLDPLPDIDFNIRCGNTLVGYANEKSIWADHQGHMFAQAEFEDKIKGEMDIVARTYDIFKHAQLTQEDNIEEFKLAKRDLNKRLAELNDTLNHHLHAATASGMPYAQWLASHQPFHWVAEFYKIIHGNGGFDVIIGNPPYVNTKEIKYLEGSTKYKDLYAYCVNRCFSLINSEKHISMIVPLSIMFSKFFSSLREDLVKYNLWLSNFDNIPASLFEGVAQRCTIFISSVGNQMFTSRLNRWKSKDRNNIFNSLTYSKLCNYHNFKEGIPMLLDDLFNEIIFNINNAKDYLKNSSFIIGFSQTARNYLSSYFHPAPCLEIDMVHEIENNGGEISVMSDNHKKSSLAVLSTDTAFLYWLMTGDGFHVTTGNIKPLVASILQLKHDSQILLAKLGDLIDDQKSKALRFKKNAGKFVGSYCYEDLKSLTRRADLLFLTQFYNSKETIFKIINWRCKVISLNENRGEKAIPQVLKIKYIKQPLLDQDYVFKEIDKVLARHYGFTEEELDFIINYDIKYRMGDELNADE